MSWEKLYDSFTLLWNYEISDLLVAFIQNSLPLLAEIPRGILLAGSL